MKERNGAAQPARKPVLPWMRGGEGIFTLAAGGYVLLYLLLQFSGWDGPAHLSLIGGLGAAPMAVLAVATAWRTAWRLGEDDPRSEAWQYVGLAYLAYLLGDVIWFLYDQVLQVSPVPSWADVAYLAFYPLMLLAVLRLPARAESRCEALKFWMDAGTVLLGASTAIWYLALDHGAGGGLTLSRLLSWAYPIGDLVLLVGIVALLLKRNQRGQRAPLLLLALALAFFILSDLAYGSLSSVAIIAGDAWSDTFAMLGQFCLVLAGSWQITEPAADLPEPEEPAGRSIWLIRFLPYAAVAFGYGLVILAMQRGTAEELQVLVLSALTINGLVVTRQVFVLRENDRLLAESAALTAELRSSAEQMKHQAYHDALTGLANRVLFIERLAQTLARTRTLAVLFLDLDGFKNINDSLGHPAGDELIAAVADRLRHCVRATDMVARFGGDEYAILLEGADREHAIRIAERMTEAVSQAFTISGKPVCIRASVGIALATEETETPDDLLRNADVAMYMAKDLGKGRYEVFEPDMHSAIMQRLELEAELALGIEQGQMVVHYQPMVALTTGQIIGMEALVRWRHPTRGLVPPVEFIHLAEETGLILPLGRFVLREACRQTRQWQDRFDAHPLLSVGVNLSAKQLVSGHLVDEVREALAESGLSPQSLVLEITESVLLQGTREVLETFQALKGLGVRLAIDDFGTGYSSLAYLRKFPVDILKIDKSFVDAAPTGPKESALMKGIVELAHALELQTIAEGIESLEQLSELQGLHCHLGQGYFFARPVDAEGIMRLLGEAAHAAG